MPTIIAVDLRLFRKCIGTLSVGLSVGFHLERTQSLIFIYQLFHNSEKSSLELLVSHLSHFSVIENLECRK